jgi:type IV secretory pathway TrbD component
MSNIWIQLLFLLVFSLALSIVVSAYRDDAPKKILGGIPRRMALFAGTVSLLAAAAYLLGSTFLSPLA